MKTKTFTKVAMIAAVYTVVTLVLAPVSYGNLQVRLSECLTMLPLIYEPSIWGVTLGCFLSNLIGAMTGMNPTGYLDALIGTVATFGAAMCTWKLRKLTLRGIPVLSILMPVIWNFFLVGAELGFLFMPERPLFGMIFNGLWVGTGELICVILGYILMRALKKTKIFEE